MALSAEMQIQHNLTQMSKKVENLAFLKWSKRNNNIDSYGIIQISVDFIRFDMI